MKKLLLILLISIISYSVYAQGDEKVETIFDNVEITHGGYGGPELKFAQINKEWGLLVGGRGGWIIASTISLGGGGYGLVTSHKVDYIHSNSSNKNDVFIRAGWGGFFLEYINSSNKSVHFTVNTMIGWGNASLTDEYNDMFNDHSYWAYDTSDFFVFEPGATMEFNLFKFFRIGLGASWRIVSGLELNNDDGSVLLDNDALSGPAFNLIFKFGSF